MASIIKRKRRENHGLVNHPLYGKWQMAKNRCFNKRSPQYIDYGARGIIMCNEWVNSFKAFYDYMMNLSNAMKSGFTIDRIKSSGNYEPNNMRWATMHTQLANRRMQKNNTTGYKGVACVNKKYGPRYVPYISYNREYIYLGCYKTAKEAAKTRNQYIIDNQLNEYTLSIIS